MEERSDGAYVAFSDFEALATLYRKLSKRSADLEQLLPIAQACAWKSHERGCGLGIPMHKLQDLAVSVLSTLNIKRKNEETFKAWKLSEFRCTCPGAVYAPHQPDCPSIKRYTEQQE
jgi:hypothetical protein